MHKRLVIHAAGTICLVFVEEMEVVDRDVFGRWLSVIEILKTTERYENIWWLLHAPCHAAAGESIGVRVG